MASDTIIHEMANKWLLDGDFQTFVDDWEQDEACMIAQWCRNQGRITFAEGRRRFLVMANRSAEVGKVVHFHIGWLVAYEIRLEWTRAVAKNSAMSALMWLEDATLSDEQDAILDAAIRDPIIGAPAYAEAIDNGELVRRKQGDPILYHPDSEVVKELLNGHQNPTG